MEKTDECIELEQEITRMFEKKQKMTIRSTFQTSAGTKASEWSLRAGGHSVKHFRIGCVRNAFFHRGAKNG